MKTIDIHTHGIGGFDTQTVSEDHILKIAEIHGRHGVSEIIPTIYSSSIEAMRENMFAIRRAMEQQKTDTTGMAARIIGMHLEGPFLNPSQCGALDGQSFIKPSEYSLKKLIEGFEDVIKTITLAPEMQGAAKLIKSISDMGIITSMGHSDAMYNEAEEGYHSGARGITHIFNAMRGIHHREPGIAGFGIMNKDVYIEIIADPYHLDARITEFIFSVKNAERIIIVSDTIKASKTDPDLEGLRDDKDILLGGTMTVQESSARLVNMGLNEEVVMKAITENPIRYLNAD